MDEAVKYVEKNYPQTARAFKSIQHDQYVLFCKKQKDYGSFNITQGGDMSVEDDKLFALTGLIIRMNDKVQRLLNVYKKGIFSGKVSVNVIDESIEDT